MAGDEFAAVRDGRGGDKMITAIYDRRSIRKYLNIPISKEDITEIIQNGIKDPSSKNRQPWKYIVVQGNAKEEIMILAATDKGLGSLWICDTYFAYFELCNWLGVAGEPVAAIALGYPAETPRERPRKNIEDIIEWRE